MNIEHSITLLSNIAFITFIILFLITVCFILLAFSMLKLRTSMKNILRKYETITYDKSSIISTYRDLIENQSHFIETLTNTTIKE